MEQEETTGKKNEKEEGNIRTRRSQRRNASTMRE
jgi:hypothetical protein